MWARADLQALKQHQQGEGQPDAQQKPSDDKEGEELSGMLLILTDPLLVLRRSSWSPVCCVTVMLLIIVGFSGAVEAFEIIGVL